MTCARTLRLSLCLVVVAGCASPASTLRDDNRRLAQTVSDLRSDRRAQDRKLRDLQHQLDEARARSASQLEASLPPALPVEVAMPSAPASQPPAAPPPGAARVVAVTDDGTEIVYEGDAAAGRPAAIVDTEIEPASRRARPRQPSLVDAPATDDRRSRVHGSRDPGTASGAGDLPRELDRRSRAPGEALPRDLDRIEVGEATRRVPPLPLAARATPRKTARREPIVVERGDSDAAGGSAGAGAAGAAYRAAVDLVKAGKLEDAIAALRGFLTRHPRHDYADNAQYWLGEAHYAQHDFARALTEFRTVIEVYPHGNKVPDALLKVGYCHAALGQDDKARAVLEQVVTLYPKSEPAALAAKRLEMP